ncbi:MAG: SAM-dependent methyltransferase [Candidatus Kuenenia stuttgartiensis]|nr:SAM-dependent methyltransferase [Candidatus Kuenenia stuttgartiensis]
MNVFNSMAEKYDAWYDSEEGKPLYESELRCLKPLVPGFLTPLLEVGVGTGRFAMHFLPATGVDPVPNALRMAEARGIKTVQGIGENLPFDDGSFGCILIIVTLCFVEDPLKVLIEAKRVLKKDGTIIIGFVPKDSPWGALYEKRKKQGHSFYGGATFYNFTELKRFLDDAGLIVNRVRSTLLRRPDEPRQAEEPVEGYIKEAGFLCVEVKKKQWSRKNGITEMLARAFALQWENRVEKGD